MAPVRRHAALTPSDADDVLVTVSIGAAGEAIALWASPENLAALTASTTQSAGGVPDPRSSRPVAARVTVHRPGREATDLGHVPAD